LTALCCNDNPLILFPELPPALYILKLLFNHQFYNSNDIKDIRRIQQENKYMVAPFLK
jgi:hypothetical protein